MRITPLLFILALATPVIAADTAHPPQAQSPAAKKIAVIDISGLQRYTRGQILPLLGLSIGQPVSGEDLDTAVSKLTDSGLFTNASYRYTYSGDQAHLSFTVIEAVWKTPVVFDNFVWFTDGELTQIVGKSLPTFDGTLPDTDAAAPALVAALEHLLHDRKLPGHVEHMPTVRLGGPVGEERFFVVGAPLSVCSIHFPGASGIGEVDLVKTVKDLVGTNYSRTESAKAAKNIVSALYLQRGYFRIHVQPVVAALAPASDCAAGVTVSLPVVEGSVYRWDHADWTGNTVVPTKQLDTALAMKSGEIADGRKIDNGFHAVTSLYRRKGYLEVDVVPQPDVDDSQLRVGFHVAITEGPQYTMGTVTVAGLSDKDAERIKKEWPAAPGRPYDDEYRTVFDANVKAAGMIPAGSVVDVQERPDSVQHVVNVVITFKPRQPAAS